MKTWTSVMFTCRNIRSGLDTSNSRTPTVTGIITAHSGTFFSTFACVFESVFRKDGKFLVIVLAILVNEWYLHPTPIFINSLKNNQINMRSGRKSNIRRNLTKIDYTSQRRAERFAQPLGVVVSSENHSWWTSFTSTFCLLMNWLPFSIPSSPAPPRRIALFVFNYGSRFKTDSDTPATFCSGWKTVFKGNRRSQWLLRLHNQFRHWINGARVIAFYKSYNTTSVVIGLITVLDESILNANVLHHFLGSFSPLMIL